MMERWLAMVAMIAMLGALTLPLVTIDLGLTSTEWLPDRVGGPLRGWLSSTGVLAAEQIGIWDILATLANRGEYGLTLLVVIFAVGLPIIAALATAACAFGSGDSDALGRIAAVAAHWTMANVFVVSLIVVLVAADALRLHFTAGWGTLCYAAAAIAGRAARI